MMPINPIIAATAADILVGMALYSHYTFGPLWTKVTGMKCSYTNKEIPMRFAGQVVASLMTASALYISIITFKKSQMSYPQEMLTKMYSWFFKDLSVVHTDLVSSMKIAAFLWLGFIVPCLLCRTIWDATVNWQRFALKSAFTLVHFLAMAGALAYFG